MGIPFWTTSEKIYGFTVNDFDWKSIGIKPSGKDNAPLSIKAKPIVASTFATTFILYFLPPIYNINEQKIHNSLYPQNKGEENFSGFL